MNSERYGHNNSVRNRQLEKFWIKPLKKNFQEGYAGLTLPGYRNLVDSKKSKFRKRIWLVIFLCCICLSVLQIAERVHYFLGYPVSMTMEIKNSSNEVQFPRLSLCSQSQYTSNSIIDELRRIEKMNNGQKPPNYGNLTAQQLWDKSGYDLSTVLENCTFGIKTCNSEKYWTTMHTVMGRCFLLNLDEVIRYHGIASGIQITLYDYDVVIQDGLIAYGRWKVLLHDTSTNVQYEILSKGNLLFKYSRTQMMYWRKEYYFENTPTHPCVPASTYKKCRSECLNSLLLNGKKCKLPFMEHMPSYPSCSIQEVAEIYSVYPPHHIFDTNNCNCGNPCYETSFDVQPDSRNAFAVFLVGNNKSRSIIDIYPSRPDIEVIKEIRAYTLATLFSDIGGALGLYLGTSILTFFEIFQTIIKAIISRVK